MAFEKQRRWSNNQREGVAGTPRPANAKAFVANFSDLSGPTNPTGILSPHFLRLKLALDRGADPDEVLEALYNWIQNKKTTGNVPTEGSVPRAQIAKILELPDADGAYEALLELIGGKLEPRGLPKLVQQTLRRVVARVAHHEAERDSYEGALATGRAKTLKQRFAAESAGQLVRTLLDS